MMDTLCAVTDSSAALARAVELACQALGAGLPVALPTETVYGLAADALNPAALTKIFEAKERPLFDPLIVHVPNRDWLERLVEIPPASHGLVERLIVKFWPGPLTLVLPRRASVPDLVTSGLETVAIRMSGHPVFRAVIEAFNRPLAAPSANRFGRISPTAAAHVASELSGRIPLIVDGGATAHGIESTIVAVEGVGLRILRSGPVTGDDLAAVLAECPASTDCRPVVGSAAVVSARPQAPGQLASHYAPRTPMILLTDGIPLPPADPGRFGLLAFRGTVGQGSFAHAEVLSADGDLREAAATLFAKMRRLDECRLDAIYAEPVPETGLGIAIMDRLRRACHRDPAS